MWTCTELKNWSVSASVWFSKRLYLLLTSRRLVVQIQDHYKFDTTSLSSRSPELIQIVWACHNSHPYLICGQTVFWLVCFPCLIRHTIHISCPRMFLPWYCIRVSIQKSWCRGTVSHLSRWWRGIFAAMDIWKMVFMFLGPDLTHWTDQKERERYENSIACGWQERIIIPSCHFYALCSRVNTA